MSLKSGGSWGFWVILFVFLITLSHCLTAAITKMILQRSKQYYVLFIVFLSGMICILFIPHSDVVLASIIALYHWLLYQVLLSNFFDKSGKQLVELNLHSLTWYLDILMTSSTGACNLATICSLEDAGCSVLSSDDQHTTSTQSGYFTPQLLNVYPNAHT